MSNFIRNQKIQGMRLKNTALTAAFEDDAARCFLLKRSTDSSKLTAVEELTEGWQTRFNEYRGQMALSVATLDAGFADLIAQASFFAYGVPDADGDLEVFSIDPDRRDVIAPNGTSPFWKVYGTKAPEERFTAPTP